MAPSLTLAELQGLARLHRARTDGAEAQLREILRDHGEELPAVLRFPVANLSRLEQHSDPIALLVATIEAVPGVVREDRQRDRRMAAQELALRIRESASICGERIDLDPALVGAAVGAWPDGGDLVFGERGGVDLRRLRALLKQCRRVPVTMALTPSALELRWVSSWSRGHFTLRLWPTVPGEDHLLVQLPERDEKLVARTASFESNAAEAIATPHAAPVAARIEQQALPGPRPHPRPLTARFLEALSAVLVEAS